MFKTIPIFKLYFVFAWVFTYLKSRIRRFSLGEFMETESGFITSGTFSASIIEPHFSNSETVSLIKSLIFKAD